jgi:hypothetical protein
MSIVGGFGGYAGPMTKNIPDNYKKTTQPGQYGTNEYGKPFIINPAMDDRFVFNPYNRRGRWSQQDKSDDQMRRTEQSKAAAAAEAARQQMIGAVESAQRGAMADAQGHFARTYDPYANNVGNMMTAYGNQESNRFGANAMMEAARMQAMGQLGSTGIAEAGNFSRSILDNLANVTSSQHTANALMNQANQQGLSNMGVSQAQARGNMGQAAGQMMGQLGMADAMTAQGIAPYAIQKDDTTTVTRRSGGSRERQNNIFQERDATAGSQYGVEGDFGGMFGMGGSGGGGTSFTATGPSGQPIMTGGYGGGETGGGGGMSTAGSGGIGGSGFSEERLREIFRDTGREYETNFDNQDSVTQNTQMPDPLLGVVTDRAFGGIQDSRNQGRSMLDNLAGSIGDDRAIRGDMTRNLRSGMGQLDSSSQRMFDRADALYDPTMNQLNQNLYGSYGMLNRAGNQFYRNTQTDPRMYQLGMQMLSGGLDQTQRSLGGMYDQLASKQAPMGTLGAFYSALDRLNYRD